MSEALDSAIALAMRGWKILPVTPKAKTPYFPIARSGYKVATDDIDLIKKWAKTEKALNFGVACAPSGLVVIDIDRRNGGYYGEFNDDTFRVRTTDGWHYYFKTSSEASYPGKLSMGVDVKFNGYVVAPGSIHPSGFAYAIENDVPPAPAEAMFA